MNSSPFLLEWTDGFALLFGASRGSSSDAKAEDEEAGVNHYELTTKELAVLEALYAKFHPLSSQELFDVIHVVSTTNSNLENVGSEVTDILQKFSQEPYRLVVEATPQNHWTLTTEGDAYVAQMHGW
jgi:hypothetical protein